MDWSCENYCDVFISCLDSDGIHSLQRIHWWFLQICSNEETNSSTSLMSWGWVHFHFWVNCYFKEWISYLDHNHEATSFPICYQHSIYSLYIYCMWFMYVVTDLCFSGVSLEHFRMWDPTYICNKHWINKKLSSYITSLKFLISFDEIVPSDSSILQLPF